MNELKSIVKSLVAHQHEEEWFEFKENWFESHALGEYISSMSNAAAMVGEEYAYFVCVYSCAGVPLFRRNGNRQSGGRKPLNRNRDTALKCLLPASLLA